MPHAVLDHERGQHLADLYSLCVSCQNPNVDAKAYLRDVLIRIQPPHSRLDGMLPHRWWLPG